MSPNCIKYCIVLWFLSKLEPIENIFFILPHTSIHTPYISLGLVMSKFCDKNFKLNIMLFFIIHEKSINLMKESVQFFPMFYWHFLSKTNAFCIFWSTFERHIAYYVQTYVIHFVYIILDCNVWISTAVPVSYLNEHLFSFRQSTWNHWRITCVLSIISYNDFAAVNRLVILGTGLFNVLLWNWFA